MAACRLLMIVLFCVVATRLAYADDNDKLEASKKAQAASREYYMNSDMFNQKGLTQAESLLREIHSLHVAKKLDGKAVEKLNKKHTAAAWAWARVVINRSGGGDYVPDPKKSLSTLKHAWEAAPKAEAFAKEAEDTVEKLAAKANEKPVLHRSDEVVVASVKEFLKIHEEAEKHVGKKIVVSPQVGWLGPHDLARDKNIEGYLFDFRFGTELKEAVRFGNNLILIPTELNYAMPSDLGRDIIADWKSTGATYYRVTVAFEIVKKQIGGKDYYLAIVKTIKKS